LPILSILIFLTSCASCNTFPENAVRNLALGKRTNIAPEPRVFYWNYTNSLRIACPLAGGCDFYGATFEQGDVRVPLSVTILSRTLTNFIINLQWPTNTLLDARKDIRLIITTNRPNAVAENIRIVAGTNRPVVEIMKTSPKIVKGGCALAVFKVNDRGPVTVMIRDSDGGIQYAQPFVRDGYWICLFAWPVTTDKWSANVVVTDRFGYSITKRIPIRAEDAVYKVCRVEVNDTFVAEKREETGDSFTNMPSNPLEKYNLILQSLAQKKAVSLTELGSRPPQGLVNAFPMKTFMPLSNFHVSSEFGEFRTFIYRGSVVRENWHLGVDMFTIARDHIHCRNPGSVVFSGYNGWSGNTLMIHHGLGLYTVYMHCSSLEFREGVPVFENDWIGRTGKTGYATGDHLHFAVMLQGRYVNPWEWMSQTWIDQNIEKVIDDALFLIANEDGA
jgi:hypothetical protein